MLSKTMVILETTVETVSRDKGLIEKENTRLKEFLQAKDLDVNIGAYRHMIDEKAKEALGRDSVDEMDRRSRSLGMRSSSQNGTNNENRTPTNKAKYGSNVSLVEKHIERSQERTNSRNKAGSQLS